MKRAVVMGMLVCVMAGMASALTPLWTENFSNDPLQNGWTQINSSGGAVTWDSANARIKMNNNANDATAAMYRAIGATLDNTTDFQVKMDVMMDYAYSYPEVSAGVFSSTGTSRVGFIATPIWNDSVFPTQLSITAQITLDDGSTVSSGSITVGQYTSTTITLVFEAETGILTLSDGSQTSTALISYGMAFAVDSFGFQNVEYGQGDLNVYMDNVSVSTTVVVPPVVSLYPLWIEDFSNNPVPPGTLVGSQYSWNATAQNFMLQNNNDVGDGDGVISSFSRPTTIMLDQNQDFGLAFDFKPDYCYYGAAIFIGLTNSTGNDLLGFYGVASGPSSYQLAMLIRDSANVLTYQDCLSLSIYTQYRLSLNYNSTSRTLTLTATPSSGDVSTYTYTLGANATFCTDQFKVFNDAGVGNNTAYLDNVSILVPALNVIPTELQNGDFSQGMASWNYWAGAEGYEFGAFDSANAWNSGAPSYYCGSVYSDNNAGSTSPAAMVKHNYGYGSLGFYQIVKVAPGGRYRLNADWKSTTGLLGLDTHLWAEVLMYNATAAEVGDVQTILANNNSSWPQNSIVAKKDSWPNLNGGAYAWSWESITQSMGGNFNHAKGTNVMKAVNDYMVILVKIGGFFPSEGTFLFDNIQFEKSIPGDANDDGMVDVGDLGILAANYGGSGKTWNQGDFNDDRVVDVGDLGILAAHYGESSDASMDFSADYTKVFGTTVAEECTVVEEENSSSMCSALGLPLVTGLALMGLMLVKLEE